MRLLPEALSASLSSGVTTLAHVWRVERRDGMVFGFTDHDRVLVLDGLHCDPVAGAAGGVIEKGAGLGPDTASIAGVLHSDALAEADLARGLWDSARVDLFKVDWTDPAQRVHLFAGRIGEVRRGASAFEAELRGLQDQLNAPVGRVFQRYCDANLGDARCGKAVDVPAYRGEGVVATILSGRGFVASGLEGFPEGWFSRGRLVWSDGAAFEVTACSAHAAGVEIELLDIPGDALTVGAAFSIYAGCDKRFETCRAKFANAANFRGFPHMPGNDAIQGGPAAGSRMDGSSRFR